MPVIDDRTAVLDVPKPNAANNLSDDVERLRLATEALAVAIHANAQAIDLRALREHVHEIGHITGLLDALNSKSEKTHKHALNDLSDVDAPDPANYHVMVRIGDKWVSAALLLAHITGWEDTVDAKIDGKIAALAGGAPATLDTFAEIAAALGDDPNFATTISTALGNRLRFDDVQTRTAAEKTQAQTNLGGTATGRAVFQAADPAAARGAIGAQAELGYNPVRNVNSDVRLSWDDTGNGWAVGAYIGEYNAGSLATRDWVNGQLGGKISTGQFDSISHVGLAGGDPNKPYMRQASNSAVLYLQRALGFTPVRCGANAVTLTWSGGRGKVELWVDASYQGDIAYEQWVAGNFAWKSEVLIKNTGDFAAILANIGQVGSLRIATYDNDILVGRNVSIPGAAGTWKTHGQISSGVGLFSRIG